MQETWLQFIQYLTIRPSIFWFTNLTVYFILQTIIIDLSLWVIQCSHMNAYYYLWIYSVLCIYFYIRYTICGLTSIHGNTHKPAKVSIPLLLKCEVFPIQSSYVHYWLSLWKSKLCRKKQSRKENTLWLWTSSSSSHVLHMATIFKPARIYMENIISWYGNIMFE